MAAEEEDVVFDRDDLLGTGTRGAKKKSQLTCNKLGISMLLCGAFFGLGLCLAMPGPTLMDLEENTDSTKKAISLIFVCRSAGYLVGSLIGGVLFDRMNQSFLLSVTLTLTCIATAVAPLCRKLLLLGAMIMFQGLSMGFLDTGGNLMCLQTWESDSGPHMQALHFAFAIGAFLAPMVAKPFLAHPLAAAVMTTVSPVENYSSTAAAENGTNRTASRERRDGRSTNETSSSGNSTATESILSVLSDDVSPVKYAYFFVAFVLAVVAFGFFLSICCCRRKSGGAASSRGPGGGGAETLRSEYTSRKERSGFRVRMLALLFVFFFVYVGSEVAYGSFISSFVVKRFGWTKETGAVVTSVFWGSFAAGRFLAIFLSWCLTPTVMLIGNLVVTSVSLVGLAAFGRVDGPRIESVPYETLVWALTSSLGVGMASIFPTGISWVERYMQVTGKAASVFVVGSALGEMAIPALVGLLFETSGEISLMYVMLACSSVSIFVYVVMQNLACGAGERYSRLAEIDEDLLPLRADDDDGGSVDAATRDDAASNGHDAAADRKKKVTFDLNSGAAKSSAAAGKYSIIKAPKRTEKKD